MNPIKNSPAGRVLLLGATLLSVPAFAAPVTLVSQNFDYVSPQLYSGASSSDIDASNPLAKLTLATSTNTWLRVDLNSTTGGNSLQFIDTQSGGAAPTVYTSVLPGVSTTATGNNRIVGSFDFKPLSVTSGSAPSFVFMINADGAVYSSSSSSVIISFENNAGAATAVRYNNGQPGGSPSEVLATLTANTNYRLDVVADYSKTGTGNFDTYSFTITDLDTSTVFYRSDPISTRANADKVPNRIAFYGGASSTITNASAFFQIDNIKFISTDTGPFVWGITGHPESSNTAAYASVVSPATQLDLVKELGCNYYRVGVSYTGTGNIATLLALADERKIKLLPTVSPGDVLDGRTDTQLYNDAYATAYNFAHAYQGKFTHVELANELDNVCIKGANYSGANAANDYDTAKYERVRIALQGLSDGVHAGDPNLKRIINAGFYHYGYLQRIQAETGSRNVDFEVVGWHWYSNMRSMGRVMEKLTSLFNGRPIWITEFDRLGGSLDPVPVFSDNFNNYAIGATPAPDWSFSGTWSIQQYGTVKALVNTDSSATPARTLTRTFASALSGNWELVFDYDWRYGGWPATDIGTKDQIIECNMLDNSNNGYRLSIRQGDSGLPEYADTVLSLYKVTNGTAILPALTQHSGYNHSGFGNGTPRLKNIRWERDQTGNYPGALAVIYDIDGDKGNDAVRVSTNDTTYTSFTKLVITTRGYNTAVTPLIDNISLTKFTLDETKQAAELKRMVSEISNFPGIEALFAYELLDEPDRGNPGTGVLSTFYEEAFYGLCSLTRNNSGRIFDNDTARKDAFYSFRDAIMLTAPIPATATDGIIVDDTYDFPATKYSDAAPAAPIWQSGNSLSGSYFTGYRHDAGITTNKSTANFVRFYPHIPVSGNYAVYVRHPVSAGNAISVPVKVRSKAVPTTLQTFYVNQNTGNGDWVQVGTGTFPFNAWQPGTPNTNWEAHEDAAYVEIGNAGTTGTVIIDAVRFKRVQ